MSYSGSWGPLLGGLDALDGDEQQHEHGDGHCSRNRRRGVTVTAAGVAVLRCGAAPYDLQDDRSA